ncbi:hypothetical protein [Ligilactobacillus ruminis]|jgi:hypothetical protein|uniref:hypothetical protein n=1 Tax=Ligilactobacillus ruminis TaxID=1623 RepID=UPI0022DFADFC|nr:hypothetical protein [Ligilactobacillus ruminis]
MAKVVKIDGNVLGFPEKNWNLIDSNTNVKKFIRNFTNWNDKILEIEDNPIAMMGFIVDEVPNILEDMLELSKSERKKLDEASFSDQYDVFREMARQFLGIDMASINGDDDLPDGEDPKKPDAE